MAEAPAAYTSSLPPPTPSWAVVLNGPGLSSFSTPFSGDLPGECECAAVTQLSCPPLPVPVCPLATGCFFSVKMGPRGLSPGPSSFPPCCRAGGLALRTRRWGGTTLGPPAPPGLTPQGRCTLRLRKVRPRLVWFPERQASVVSPCLWGRCVSCLVHTRVSTSSSGCARVGPGTSPQ